MAANTAGMPPAAAHAAHLRTFGAEPAVHRRRERAILLEAVAASGLRGRGGAGFPTHRKLVAVAEHRGRRVAVANGTEGEPLSHKDSVLLRHAPHLVIDGLLLAAGAVGADSAALVVSRAMRGLPALRELVDWRAARSRDVELTLHEAPERFVVGEESALVNWLNGGPAKPTITPPRPSERGVRGRPTLVQNAETLAHMALIARFGADWFRQLGTRREPGTLLLTVTGPVRTPGVCEVPLGTTVERVLEMAGGLTAPMGGMLVGGYFGTWVAPLDVADLRVTHDDFGRVGASLGAGTLGVLPAAACPIAETARVMRYLARESAGQCGPCVFGLPALADALGSLARRDHPAQAEAQLRRLAGLVDGRGACALPNGAARLVRSLLTAFPQELERHRGGACCATRRDPAFPVPAPTSDWR
ncbi:MAG: NADH-ubiquinone oxidoreductase-F iron-sulfur binding region domain-containing protein [Thermoleophilia bacterium]